MFRVVDAGVIRRAVGVPAATPAWPDTNSPAALREWIAAVWADPVLSHAVGHASPTLAHRVESELSDRRLPTRKLRRIAMSLARYLLRYRRSTPFGLFAGVGPLRLGRDVAMEPGHRVVMSADALWLSDVIGQLEATPRIVRHLSLVTNDAVHTHGERLLVSAAPHATPTRLRAATSVTLRRTRAVRTVMSLARTPILGADLIDALQEQLPHHTVDQVNAFVGRLLECGLLISSLRPPATHVDALAHVIEALPGKSEKAIVDQLRQIHDDLRHGDAVEPVRHRMRAVTPVADQPVTVTMGVGAVTVPEGVLAELASAAGALARAAPPRSTSGDYYDRFVDRYGTGSLVPVADLLDPTHGLGAPPIDSPDPRPVTERDAVLLALAQRATATGAREVVLDDDVLDALDDGRPPVPHLDVCAELHATSPEDLEQGEFTLAVRGTGRSAFALTSRFHPVLHPEQRQRMRDQARRLPPTIEGAVTGQLNFPPRHLHLENVTRTPQLLSEGVSVAEHSHPGQIRIDDLAVTADRDRLILVSLSRECVMEPVVFNAAARAAWPPAVRLMAEIARWGTRPVTPWAWGPVASTLPFLPRIRYGRTILSPARWRVHPNELPPPQAPELREQVLAVLRERQGWPRWVSVGEADRFLTLDLEAPMDRVVLRDHLDDARDAGSTVDVREAASPRDRGWIDGRAHEIVVPLAATTPPAPRPAIRSSVVLSRPPAELPGGRVLNVHLYGPEDHVDAILTDHLPDLLTTTGDPLWWFIRYQRPEPHLRLRLHPARGRDLLRPLSAWADRMRDRGLIASMSIETYRPEVARYGAGDALHRAEALFAADSRAVVAQVAERRRHPLVTSAATSMVHLARALAPSPEEGLAWLQSHPRTSGPALPQDQVRHAITMTATPPDALRRVWEDRDDAAADYRDTLTQNASAPTPRQVLGSLMHMHHIRVIGVDPESERATRRIARAIARSHRERKGTR